MASGPVSATIAGLLGGLAVGLGPKAFDKWANRRRDEQDGAEVLAGGAGAVTATALALLERHDADAATARAAEAQCRADLAAANARIDALEALVATLTPPGL